MTRGVNFFRRGSASSHWPFVARSIARSIGPEGPGADECTGACAKLRALTRARQISARKPDESLPGIFVLTSEIGQVIHPLCLRVNRILPAGRVGQGEKKRSCQPGLGSCPQLTASRGGEKSGRGCEPDPSGENSCQKLKRAWSSMVREPNALCDSPKCELVMSHWIPLKAQLPFKLSLLNRL